MERVTIRHITPSAPTPLPPARRPLVLRLTSAAQDKRWRTSSAPRSCRRRSALLPASRRGGRPPCKQHERLVSPSPRPAASSRTSPSILYASTAHRGVAVSSRRRATAPPVCVAEVSSSAIVTRDRPVRLSIARLHLPARPALGLPLQLVRMVRAVPDHSQQSLLRRARLLGARKTNALNALTRPRSTGRRMSQTTSLEGGRASSSLTELRAQPSASITKTSGGASGSRIELQLATTAALLTIVRRKHGMPQRPAMQYLQGVALRRTCRIDGVRVTVHCARRRPSAAHRNDVTGPVRGTRPPAALGVRDRRHAVHASTGVPRPRKAGGDRSMAPCSKFHQCSATPTASHPE